MEWIKYHEKEKVFELKTKNSTYQMQVREYDTLVHLYFLWIHFHRNILHMEMVTIVSMVWRQSRRTEVTLQI